MENLGSPQSHGYCCRYALVPGRVCGVAGVTSIAHYPKLLMLTVFAALDPHHFPFQMFYLCSGVSNGQQLKFNLSSLYCRQC
jgi:hypothetical protein